MARVRVVTPSQPSLKALAGRPLSPEIRRRVDAALPPERIELIVEPDAGARLEALKEAEFYLCENQAFPEGFFEAGRRLRLIQGAGQHLERLDMEAAARRGIPVATFPLPVSEAVADHSFALLLALTRSLPEAVRRAREGFDGPPSPVRPDGSAYNWTQLQGVRALPGKRMGILGLGDIGRCVARRARAFGMEVRYWNRTPLPGWMDRKVGAKRVEKEELYRTSDVLWIGVGLNPETVNFVTESDLRALPRGAYVINVARGPIVDERGLHDALADGHLAGAGLDVFATEPCPTDHPLLRLPNVIPTPHVAGGDDDMLVAELEMFMENVHRVLAGKRPRGIANGVRWRG